MAPEGERIESWKAIAAYLARDVTTVRRWEKHEGLPIHRHVHQRSGSVFANTSELDAWRAGRDRASRGQQDRPARPSLSLASGRTIAAGVLALAITAFGAYLPSRAWPTAPPATRIESARQAHMRGLYYWNKRTEEGFRLALDQFTQALDHDPGYAPAWVGMADTFALMGYYRMLPVNES